MKSAKYHSWGKGMLIFASLLFISLLSSCHHKDIDFEEVVTQEVNVLFDWRNAPEASPSSMAAYFYNLSQGSTAENVRFDFANSTGGEIRIPIGSYSGLAMNTDNTDWAQVRNSESMEDFEIYTREVSVLSATNLSTRAIPKARGAEEETTVETPGMLYSAREDNMTLTRKDKKKTFVFYPEEAVCHYTVDIINIENLSSIDGKSVDATISGMSGGYSHGQKQATDTHHTLPFILVKEENENSLHGEFLTFGESPVTKHSHLISLYLLLSDGNKYFYTFDVSRQIYEASDPRHVHIIINGLSVPKAITGGNGFIPDVNEWKTVDIDLKM